jgi:hypothetical protein
MASNDAVGKSEPDFERRIKSAVGSAVEDKLSDVDIEADVRTTLDRANKSDEIRSHIRDSDLVDDAEQRIEELIDRQAIVEAVLDEVDYDDNADDQDIEREAELAAGQAVDEVVAGPDARDATSKAVREAIEDATLGAEE